MTADPRTPVHRRPVVPELTVHKVSSITDSWGGRGLQSLLRRVGVTAQRDGHASGRWLVPARHRAALQAAALALGGGTVRTTTDGLG